MTNEWGYFHLLPLASLTWKCSCPGTLRWGNSGRNMLIKLGKLHSMQSFSGPGNEETRCSGMDGSLSQIILCDPIRNGLILQSPAGREIPTAERNPLHLDICDCSSDPMFCCEWMSLNNHYMVTHIPAMTYFSTCSLVFLYGLFAIPAVIIDHHLYFK